MNSWNEPPISGDFLGFRGRLFVFVCFLLRSTGEGMSWNEPRIDCVFFWIPEERKTPFVWSFKGSGFILLVR